MPAGGEVSARTAGLRWHFVPLIALTVGLQFQVVAPIGVAGIKVCPADLVAAILTLILIGSGLRARDTTLCRNSRLIYWLTAASAALLIGTLIGYLRLGFVSSWALGAKLAGWVGLLSYLFSGLWIGSLAGDRRSQAMASLTWASLLTGIVSVFLTIDFSVFRILPPELVHFPVHGFVGNRNAFIFLQLAALTFLLVQDWLSRPIICGTTREVLLGVAGVVTFYSGSRSGLPVIGIILVIALLTRAIKLRTMFRACVYGVGIWLAIEVVRVSFIWIVRYNGTELENMGGFGKGLPPLFVEKSALAISDVTNGSSDSERWTSYALAVKMWLQSPLFGSGIGTFIETYAAQYGHPLVIHNTALWLLTETGVVGLSVFLGLGWALVRPLFPLHAGTGDDPAFRLMAVMLVLGFVIMSQVHDMMYQRVLWLVLGMGLSTSARKGQPRCVD